MAIWRYVPRSGKLYACCERRTCKPSASIWPDSRRRPSLAISHYEIYSKFVHVITRKRLREFAARHREAAEPLGVWYVIMSKTDFGSFAELKRVFRSVDKVGKFTVFDIGGNKFRLIAAVHYNRKKVYIRCTC